MEKLFAEQYCDVQIGDPYVQIPKPIDPTSGRGRGDLRRWDGSRFRTRQVRDIMDQRTAGFRTLEKVDDAIEKVFADPAAEHPTASVVARLKAVLDDDQQKTDRANKTIIRGNGSPGEAQLENEIRNFTRFVNRNQEAPLDGNA
jgi:hypothetical protein